MGAVVRVGRDLFGNPSVPAVAWPMQNAVPATLLWCALPLLLCGPPAVRRFATYGTRGR
ncbi:hypothetical protein [Kitasatospora sp. NPDC008115]|uniref:hypothetical protein n=1 Tax=Kitasatospora sp. NPDC008115 TaxID=3364022 RepID=UPI0036E1EA7F